MPAREPPGREGVRLAQMLAPLSMVTDLARAHPPEEAMRACLVATGLAELLGLSPADRGDVYYTALLRFIGCTATSTLYADAYRGDDVAVRRLGDLIDARDPGEVLSFLWALSGTGPGRVVALLGMARQAGGAVREGVRADCEVAVRLASRLGFGAEMQRGLAQLFERWDGRGGPGGLRGEAIAAPARVTAVAYTAVMFDGVAGREGALAALRRWRGRILDPAVVEVFLGAAGDLLDRAHAPDPLQAVLAAEPAWPVFASPARQEAVATVFADLADLKSTYLHGHSSGVADLAHRAAGLLGTPGPAAAAVRLAGLLHDLGRVTVPTGVWNRPGPLSSAEWEQVRLHPYHSERILARVEALADVAAIAGRHHERIDGSGYHRGLTAPGLDLPARVLAAADTFHALTEPRPHRPALSRPEAARQLEALAAAGTLDAGACSAVAQAAGERTTGRAPQPAGLSQREIEVLRLLARGHTERAIAAALHVSASTVHTHVLHIYEKAGVSTRAAAALFAMESGLLAGA